MSSQRAMRRMLSLILALSVGLWAESGLAMLSAAGDGAQCHARMPRAHHAAAVMPCCPSQAAVAIVHFIEPPPCCDLSNQPARPLGFVVVPGKFRSGQLSANGTAGAMFVPPRAGSALSLIGDSPPFVKPVFDLKTDLRI